MAAAKTGRASKPRAPTRKTPARIAHAREVLELLAEAIPDPKCELNFGSPFELLIATILSAQTTDRGVNRVTPELFRRFPTPAALAEASQSDVEAIVKPTGFFRVKAKNIRGAARAIAERHGGEVPRTMDELLKLPGVARKTANVVLGTAYGIASGITVDTHARRVAQRLGLTKSDDPVVIEQDLMALAPRDTWPDLGHRLVLHGRYTCLARNPKCPQCRILSLCPAPEARSARRAALVN